MSYDNYKLDNPPSYDYEPGPMELLIEEVQHTLCLSTACDAAGRTTGDVIECEEFIARGGGEGQVTVSGKLGFDLALYSNDDLGSVKKALAALLRAVAEGLGK